MQFSNSIARQRAPVTRAKDCEISPEQTEDTEMSWWTPDRERELRALHAEGLTFSQIAKRLGAPSRNAIIGKVNRMGLPRRTEAIKPKAGGSDRPTASPAELQAWLDCAMEGHIPANVRPAQKGLSLTALKDGVCRYPLWKTDADPKLYCGAPAIPGKSWCPVCYERVFDRTPLRRLRAA